MSSPELALRQQNGTATDPKRTIGLPQSGSGVAYARQVPLDERDAFNAMFRFLESYWERIGRPDELGILLGSLSTELTDDGMPRIAECGRSGSRPSTLPGAT